MRRFRRTGDGLGKKRRVFKNLLRRIRDEWITTAKPFVAYAEFPGRTLAGCYASHHFPHRR
jgi:hypothetical protein